MKILALVLFVIGIGHAQVTVPEGTKLRVKLESTISSATAEEGQIVELIVSEAVKVGDVTVITEGARVTGTVTEAQGKRRMGRAGKLDFSIDRVRAVDNEWLPLRYTVTKKSGESHSLRTGVITAGVAVVFWPAAPVMLLMKGKDIVINKGVAFDVYTDNNHLLAGHGGNSTAGTNQTRVQPPSQQAPASQPPSSNNGSGSATVTVTSTIAGADIEVDGAFVGSTPTILQLIVGSHNIVVKGNGKSWERTLQVNAGSTISLNATLK